MDEVGKNFHINQKEQCFHQSVDDLIRVLHRAHLDNAKQQYFAHPLNRHPTSIMPFTSFVFEFFIYNSLYQVDWGKSFAERQIIYHPVEYSESKQQREFIKFLKNKTSDNAKAFYRAFLPFSFLPTVEGIWTRVNPDARISVEIGDSFFRKIRELQSAVAHAPSPEEMATSNKIYDYIEDSSYFIYLVRNNIFHGSKTLGEVYEKNQAKRIEVYDLFLKGLTSLFFLLIGESSAASDLVQLPIHGQVLASQNNEILTTNEVWNIVAKRLMKPEDPRLLYLFTNIFNPIVLKPSDNTALFYPSAGCDFATPILIGLPYCRDFYFYDYEARPENRRRRHQNLLGLYFLEHISGITIENPEWQNGNNEQIISFEYAGIKRTVHWVHKDNMDFLQKDVGLTFYFHRGDSEGESGSRQQWDSKLIPELIKKIPSGFKCLYLTDGEPGGLLNSLQGCSQRIDVPYTVRMKTYFCGTLLKDINLVD